MSRKLLLPIILGALAPHLAGAETRLPPCPTSRKLVWTDCQGAYTYDDWSRYVGEFWNDRRHGQGTIAYPDGQVYTGGFKNDRRDGPGVYTNPSGVKWTGEFRDDRPNGHGVLTDRSGRVLKAGVWVDGKYVEDKAPSGR